MLQIGWTSLFYMLIPLIVVGFYMYKWELPVKTLLYGTARMFLQLLAIGYVLVYIFKNDHWIVATLIVLLMVSVASWISLRNIE